MSTCIVSHSKEVPKMQTRRQKERTKVGNNVLTVTPMKVVSFKACLKSLAH